MSKASDCGVLQLLTGLGLARIKTKPDYRRFSGQVHAIWPETFEAELVLEGIQAPHLAWTMLFRTLVRGLRGNPLHPRPLDQDSPELAETVLTFVKLHLRIQKHLPDLVLWPEQGLDADQLIGDGGWCDLCGQCCCHAGTVPHPPQGIDYPPFFYHALAGETLYPQPFCPFLFQAMGQPAFFCGIHPVKPIACSRFDKTDCERGSQGRGCITNDS
ncbi:hypothetical protein [Dethiosulfatarculus sandiegensis]|uniref:Uncharacterized protein n=1 Tax=Dethiosulfatarculus sandiegensis TaxID=1429043 RepID=A0A0D2GKB7_9BACT|nr:hypothetical protein [Dethiosulfatarculus sandiegensis]KIX15212.1 hypothetical protein X474_05005 [Dethiosulfatarculus sandiegensis]